MRSPTTKLNMRLASQIFALNDFARVLSNPHPKKMEFFEDCILRTAQISLQAIALQRIQSGIQDLPKNASFCQLLEFMQVESTTLLYPTKEECDESNALLAKLLESLKKVEQLLDENQSAFTEVAAPFFEEKGCDLAKEYALAIQKLPEYLRPTPLTLLQSDLDSTPTPASPLIAQGIFSIPPLAAASTGSNSSRIDHNNNPAP